MRAGIAAGIEKGRVAVGRVAAAIERRAPAPAAAAGQRAAGVHHEIGAVLDELKVEPHAGAARFDLLGG